MSRKRNHRMAGRLKRQGGPVGTIMRAEMAMGTLSRMAALQSTDPISAGQRTDISLLARNAYELLRTGQANDEHLNTLATAVNIALVLAEADLGHEWISVVQAGQAALLAINERHARQDRWGATGPELQAVLAMIDLHEAQLHSDDCTEGLVMAALEEVARRVRSGAVSSLPHAATQQHV